MAPTVMEFPRSEIRARFDREVERFSNLETGQTATIDAPLALKLIRDAASRLCPRDGHLLDAGCGAGNYTLKLLEAMPELRVTLIDLSRPMLDRALERVKPLARTEVQALQGDIRELDLGTEQFDLIVASMVLHHLREEAEWSSVFQKLWRALKPGGSLWISDFVSHSIPPIQEMMWEQYGEYLTQLKNADYKEHVFRYVEKEDSPRPLLFQTDLLRSAGFGAVEVLHKNNCFVVFGGIKNAAE
jgi:tRNA (cmo5U34)-methyltransferase